MMRRALPILVLLLLAAGARAADAPELPAADSADVLASPEAAAPSPLADGPADPQQAVPAHTGATAGSTPPAGLTFDTSCSSTVPSGSSTDAHCTMNISASATQVLACGGSPADSTSATVGASGMTSIANTNPNNGNEQQLCWQLASPPTGSQTITLNFSSSTINAMWAISWTGGMGMFANADKTASNTTTPSVTIPSATGHVVVASLTQDMGNCGTATATENMGQTAIKNDCTNGQFRLAVSTAPGAATVPVGYTLVSGTVETLVGVDVQ